MPWTDPVGTFSRQDAARLALRKLGVCGLFEEPDAESSAKAVDAYEALYAEIDWRGIAPWPIDFAPRRVQNGVVLLLTARLRPDFKGGAFSEAEEAQGWRVLNAANSPAASWKPVVSVFF